MVGQTFGDPGPRLFHMTENASGTTGLDWIATVPTFLEAQKVQDELLAFQFCSLSAAPDGTVFFQTFSHLWKITPQPSN